MVAAWAVVLSALVYLCLLFTVAYWGDNAGRRFVQGPARSTIAALCPRGLLHLLDLLRIGRALPAARASTSSPSISARSW